MVHWAPPKRVDLSVSEHDLSDLGVLIIDDSRAFLSLLTDVLHGFGIRNIIRSTDAIEGFEIIGREKIDIALVDYEMPLINGLEFANMVRTAPDSGNRFISMILVTAFCSRKIVMESIKAGYDDFLAKPMRPADLHNKLIKLTRGSKDYILTPSGYFGPDRRRRIEPNDVPKERRSADLSILVGPRDINAITRVQALASMGNTAELRQLWEDRFKDLVAKRQENKALEDPKAAKPMMADADS